MNLFSACLRGPVRAQRLEASGGAQTCRALKRLSLPTRAQSRCVRTGSRWRLHASELRTLLVVFAMSATAVFGTPTISITSPASGSTIPLITSPGGATITATATPTAGSSLVSVQFFDNGTSIGTVGGTSPFSINWVPTSAGSHTLTATVTDNSVPTTGTTPSVNTATATSIVTVTTARTAAVLAPKDVTVAQGSEVFL